MHIESVLVTDKGIIREGYSVKIITDNRNIEGTLITIDKELNMLEIQKDNQNGIGNLVSLCNIKEIYWCSTKCSWKE